MLDYIEALKKQHYAITNALSLGHLGDADRDKV
jgi:hypothetical protein